MTQIARHPSIEAFAVLDAPRRREALIRLAEDVALRVWTAFVGAEGSVSYQDSVVGMSHTLDVELPAQALGSLKRRAADADRVAAAYAEPIVALQDLDLELPAHAEYAYYSIYNLFRKYCRHEDIEESLILNQILSSLSDEVQIAGALQDWP